MDLILGKSENSHTHSFKTKVRWTESLLSLPELVLINSCGPVTVQDHVLSDPKALGLRRALVYFAGTTNKNLKLPLPRFIYIIWE